MERVTRLPHAARSRLSAVVRRVAPQRRLIASAGAILLGAALHPLSAQSITGQLVRTDGSAAFGVQIVALEDGSLRVIGRTITNAAGRFYMPVSSTPLVLRALRIGHHPVDLARVTLQPGEERALRLRLMDNPIPLRPLATVASSRCERSDRAATELVELFSDVRHALQAVRLSSVDGPPEARIALVDEVLDARGASLAEPFIRMRVGPSLRPFQALSADSLSREGYVVQEPDGVVYRAPDSEVLASDAFLQEHCFQLVAPPADHPEWVGIGFQRSAASGGVIGIKGTFWVERDSRTLQQLDFQYDGLPRELGALDLGGRVRFVMLPDGGWFESDWSIRMARSTIRYGSRQLVVEGLQRTGGEVLDMRRAGQLLYVGNQPLALRLAQAEQPTTDGTARFFTGEETLAAVCVGNADDDPATSLITGTVFDEQRWPVPGAVVRTDWRTPRRVVGNEEHWMEMTLDVETGSDGFYRLCGAPREVRQRLSASIDLRQSLPLVMRIPKTADRVRADLTVLEPSPSRP